MRHLFYNTIQKEIAALSKMFCDTSESVKLLQIHCIS